ncbi:PstC family ABC transporter permease [Oleidesulfovibrio sp.]|uniref:PstC family ABC transporter permease n=1 Tax=Oleidesulfovibrio sp. TaxID=2909707 RepID=UPI003A8A1FED
MVRTQSRCARVVLVASAATVATAVAAIFGFLIVFALPVFSGGQGLSILGAVWHPAKGLYGIMPMLAATVGLSLSALLIGWPLALGVCCCIHGLAPRPAGRALTLLLRGMTAFPTVVYGFAAVFLLVPAMRGVVGGSGFCIAAAALVLSLVALPTMALVMDAGMQQAENRLRLSGAAIGFTPAQTLVHLVLPACRKNCAAAAVLGFGRAIGDTLIPLMLAGNAPQWPLALSDSVRALTAHIGLVIATDSNSALYSSVFIAGCLLLLFNTIVQLALRAILKSGEQA